MKPKDVMDNIVNRILKIPLGDIRTLKTSKDECTKNIGYPVCMLITACIELVGSFIYNKNCPTDQFAYYMRKYMGQVNPLYKVIFEVKYCDFEGKLRDSHISDLLYSFFRSELAHIANAVDPFPIDAQSRNYSKHLKMQGNGTILIHAYQLYYDFMGSLNFLYKDLKEKPALNEKVMSNIELFDDRLLTISTEIRKTISSQPRYTGGAKLKQYPQC